MGIAEGSAMSFAVGQALEGFMPFYVNFAMFVTGRHGPSCGRPATPKPTSSSSVAIPVWMMARTALRTTRWRILP
jgi:hypothetical protein